MSFVRKTGIFTIITLIMSAWLASYAYADTIGDQRSFFVNEKYDQTSRSSIMATLRAVGQHAYFYVDDVFWSTLNQAQREYYGTALESLAREFDSKIYPVETQFWGQERIPGIDGDLHVSVLLENVVTGNGGYFDSIHNYSRAKAPRSNEREMVIVNVQSLGTGYDKMFLGHEFQHLIAFNQKEVVHDVSEEVWLNELRSEYTATLLGYNTPIANSNLGRRVPTFLNNPSDSLTEWPNVSQDYAGAAMFAEYITGRFGSRILSETLRSASAGIPSVNNWLARNGYSERFDDVFLDWMVASWRNDSTARFGYTNDSLRGVRITPSYQASVYPDAEYITEFTIKPWQPVWYKFDVSDTVSQKGDAVRFSVAGAPGQFGLAYAVVWDDGDVSFQKVQTNQGATTGFVFTDDRTSIASVQKRVRSILVVATSVAKQSEFLADEPAFPLSLTASSVARQTALDIIQTMRADVIGQPQAVADGALVKRNNDEPEAYVILGSYKRYLRPNIIALYGHLSTAHAVPLDGALFDRFITSNYIRSVNDEKVYAVWPDGTKHWLRMTGEYFAQSGRDWNAIFIVNDSELNAYKTGPDITR